MRIALFRGITCTFPDRLIIISINVVVSLTIATNKDDWLIKTFDPCVIGLPNTSQNIAITFANLIAIARRNLQGVLMLIQFIRNPREQHHVIGFRRVHVFKNR